MRENSIRLLSIFLSKIPEVERKMFESMIDYNFCQESGSSLKMVQTRMRDQRIFLYNIIFQEIYPDVAPVGKSVSVTNENNNYDEIYCILRFVKIMNCE